MTGWPPGNESGSVMPTTECTTCGGRGAISTWDNSTGFAGDIVCPLCRGSGKLSMKKKPQPSDTEMLNWLQENMKGYGKGWICRNSGYGRGLRVHETEMFGAKPTIREAIADAMKKGI